MPAFDSLNLIPDKQTVVIDIGGKYTKFGFSGETCPRFIIPTESISADTGKTVKVLEYALMHPKDKRVIIVESLLCPTKLRNTLASVLFDHFEVASIMFLPSHLVALYTLGINTGLVLDVGYDEAVLIPVYEGIPILKAWQSLPLASREVERDLRSRLVGKVRCVTKDSDSIIDISCLGDSILEDIKVKGCFVTTLERGKAIAEGRTLDILPQGFTYRVDGDKIIQIEPQHRELPYEKLFEQDGDHLSISTMILDSILKCSVDLRRQLAENIVLIGGTTMAAGFKSRLKEELLSLLKEPRYSDKLFLNVFKFHKPPAKENYVAWLGGSICGATEMVVLKSLTRDQYYDMKNQVPDWSSLVNRGDSIQTQKTLHL